jgi:PAP2 superfamily
MLPMSVNGFLAKHAVWAAVATFCICAAILTCVAGLSVEFANWHIISWSAMLFVYLSRRYFISITWPRRAECAIETLVQLSMISVAAGCAQYALAALSSGYIDHALVAADAALGFDWVVLYEYMCANKSISAPLRLSYLAIFCSPFVLICWLCFSGRCDRARLWVMVYVVSLTITLVIFPFFPSKSALTHNFGADFTYMPATGDWQAEIIDKLRSGVNTKVFTGNMAGLIGFPSFHAAMAILLIWASISVPVLRVGMILVNTMMLIATPIEGAHYLVDVIGGVGVAICSILCVQHGRAFVGSWGMKGISPVPSLNNQPGVVLR